MQNLILIVIFLTVMGLVLVLGMWLGRPNLARQRVNELAEKHSMPEAL